MAVRDFADYGTDVPALRVLHDYGSEDDGEVEEVAVYRCVHRCFSGDAVATESRGLRTAVRAVPCWTNSDADRDLVGVESRVRVFTQRRKGRQRGTSYFFAPLHLCTFAPCEKLS